jgi:putative ABC transport system permease protein
VKIVGVMPRGIRFPSESDLWRPLIPGKDAEGRADRTLTVFGRLAPGSGISSARAQMSTIADRLAAAYPATNKDVRFRVQSYNDMALPRKLRPIFYTLLGAVTFVLLIACANVANLMMSRAVKRAREISVRAALGASRWRIVRQLLAESLVLALAGGGLGWVLAIWAAKAFDTAVIPTGKPSWIDFSPDYRVLAYLTAISLASAILFGLLPALRLSRLDLNGVMKDGGRGVGKGLRSRSLSGALVITEMALAVVLLTGAGLMIRSYLLTYTAPTGVDEGRVLTMGLELGAPRYQQPADRWAFWQRLRQELAGLPGVEAVTIASATPGSREQVEFTAEGETQTATAERRRCEVTWIAPDYFRALGTTVRQGRDYTAADVAGADSLVIVNEAFAARVWPGRSAIGKRLRTYRDGVEQPWMTVLAVAPDILQSAPDPAGHTAEIYPLFTPRQQRAGFHVLARTRVPPATLGDAFRRGVQAVNEDQPVGEIDTLQHLIELSTWPVRVFGSMFAIFAGIAFLLASIGLYAVVAHSVSERLHEIGVRMAMGASASRVLRMVLAQGMRQLAIGLALGLGGAWAVTRLLGNLLVGVSPHDPVTFAAVAVVLGAAGVAGCAIPARRAARVDLVETLRCD